MLTQVVSKKSKALKADAKRKLRFDVSQSLLTKNVATGQKDDGQ